MATTSTDFPGTNNRSMSLFLNQKCSDGDVFENQKTGKLFFCLSDVQGDERNVAMSPKAQEKFRADGEFKKAEYEVWDMPAKDATTGAPIPGRVFTLICPKNTSNSLAHVTR